MAVLSPVIDVSVLRHCPSKDEFWPETITPVKVCFSTKVAALAAIVGLKRNKTVTNGKVVNSAIKRRRLVGKFLIVTAGTPACFE